MKEKAVDENTCQIQKRTFLQWLFPTRHLDVPGDKPDYAEGYITTNTVCIFDWIDRLRILVSGRVEVKVYTKTDLTVNKAYSTSVVYVLPPTRSRRGV